MEKTTFANKLLVVLVFLLCFGSMMGQNLVPFSPRYDEAIKGDILLIGNSNVGLHVTDPYNGTDTNDRIDAAVYVDVDSDATTFNSSTADLDVPNDVNCYQIVYAGLYWSAVVNGSDPISEIKFKVPGGNYVDITGTEVYFQNAANNNNSNTYVYYHDVTSMVTALADPEGTYAVANISSLVGPKPNSEGLSAGWSLFIVYEDPLLPSKYITSFDGFTKITSTISETFPVSGFTTIPTGPVRANFAFSTIEGDRRYTGDYLRLNGTTIDATNNAGTVIRPGNNFFNSTVSYIDPATNTPELFTTRNPDGSNTLGFDAGIIPIPNPGNTLIANGATSATISLGSTLDIYYYYFSAFAIEIIAPNIVLTKIVEDEFGNDIGGQLVNLGDELYYTIGFQNTGNDDATNLTIRDILPENIVFNYPTDLGVLPPGVTVQSYNPTTKEIIFSIDRSIVEENDPVTEIRFMVTVVSSCSLLNDACSNVINNQAYATYQGTINPTFTISDDPSFATNTGCLLTPGATNFLADLNCDFTEEVILCGSSVTLTAGDGYDSYSWSTSPSGTPVIGTTQSITVSSTGTYYVHNTATAPCQSIDQQFDVVTFGAGVTNPLIPFADEVVICPNDGKELPNFYLCGANDSRFIQTGITDTTSIIWEKLDESSCAAVANQDCANEDSACTWNQVATGPDFTIDTSGQYRLTLNYTGGCFNQFYFNVYTNLLIPTVTSRDIYCTTPGEITVGGVPSGYEYSIDGTNYQTSNVFSVTTAGLYNVYIRQIGVSPNPCIFSVPDVQIRDRDFTVSTIVTQPLCHDELGSVSIAANDVRPQYFFSIYDGATLVNSVGPITPNNYTFSNLNAGTYTINVSTEDGCVYSGDIEIINPPLLEATAALTKPLTCTDGEITVYPSGGTPPYYYFVNSTTVFQGTPIVNVPTAGVYNITVVDSNNCSVDVSINVDATLPPDFNVSQTNILCSDETNSGSININVTNPNGNSLEYSIDNGVTYLSSPVFSGLSAGNYDVIVRYTAGTDVCTTAPQPVTITAATAIDGTATLTTPYTCTTNGVITVSAVSGGTPPYEYSIDGVNFQTGTTFTGLTDGTYTVTIRDANICTFLTAPITIDPLNPPTDLDFSSTPVTCPALTSDVTITTTGGTLPLEYRIISPSTTAYQTSNIFAGLSPNTYTFEVRDANNCTYVESYTIPPLPPIRVSMVITKDLDCTASPDGTISAIITGGTAPFNYQVSFNGGGYGSSTSVTGSSFTHTATADGTYQFLITDANGCTVESGVQTINAITLPEIISVVQTQPILCNGDSNAAIQITINNSVGTPAFVLNVFNNTTATDYGTQTSGLPAGNYTITLTDSKSCTDVETITINEPSPIAFDLSKVDITCSNPGGSSLGSITVENVTGGTIPFTYYITNNFGDVIPGNPYAAATNEDHTFNIINYGTYTVNVVDANGCSLAQQIVIASPPSDLLIDVTTVVPDCTTGGTATVQAISAVGSGSYEFGILEFNFAPYTSTFLPPDLPGGDTRTFTNLTPGVVYTFVVHDLVTDCYYVKQADSAIAPASPLTSSVVPNNVICQGENNGSVTFTIDNFDSTTTSVDYEIFTAFTHVLVDGPTNLPVTFGVPETVTTPTPGTLAPGQYYIRFTENGTGSYNGCESASVIFEINESAVDLDISATVDKNANCNPNSGVISAIASNGTAPYLYQITTTPAAPLATDPSWNSANVFNMDAGSYYVHVIDAYGCIKTTPVLVLPSDPEPVIDAIVSNQCTVTEGNFEIDVTLVTPGIAPYSFSIDGGAFQTRTAPFTISNLSSGTHTVEIQDANGCGNLVTVDILAPINLIPDVTAIPTCNDDDGEITITGSGGSGTYSYSISPNPASISIVGNVFTGVPSGTYTVTITDVITTCSENIDIFVPAATPVTFTTTSSPVTCLGDNDGSISINITNYSGPYDYEVFDSTSTSVFGVISANTSTNPEVVTGLLSGNYTIVVTETASPFCSTTSNTIFVGSPVDALTVVATETSNVTCDDDKGTITATASGGWGTYEYELTGAATVAYSSNGTFTNLSAGAYTVNVRDAGGCIASDNITLVIPPPISATVSASTSLLSCFGDANASITVSTVSGGQGSNYTYTLNMTSPTVSSSGPQTSPIFNNLGAGTYNIVVTDGYNCSFNSPDIVIAEPTQVQASLVKETSQTCLTNSTLTLSAVGGTGNYEYSDTASFSTVLGSFITSTTFSVPVGTYDYYVRDANGCISNASNEITIDPLPTLNIILDVSNATINCNGDTTGVIVATAEGGLGSYIYTLEDTLGNPITPVTQDSPGVFTNLPVGTYQVRVDSGDCLTTSSQITITEPAQPLTASFVASNVTCPGTSNGMLEITASGGTGVIKYAISPRLDQFFETSTFQDLPAGNYQAIAQDELGCFVLFDFIIEDPIPVSLTIVPNSIIPEACSGDLDGEFSIDISGGEMPYSVALDDINGTYITGSPTQTQFDFTGLAGGDHIVYVLDNLGCPTEWNITFPPSVLIQAELDIEYCTNTVDATSNMVTVNVDDSSVDLSDLDYALDGGAFQTSNVFTNLAAGNHYITIRHTNTCEEIIDFEIEQFDPLTLVLEDGNLNEIVAVADGGSGDYEYELNGVSKGSTNTFLIYESGDYTVTVTDSNGCIASATRYFEYIDVCIPNYFTPNGDGNLDEWGPGCTSQYREMTFDIFDRYGRKIATLRVNEKWDGMYKGKELPTGDYWYVVRLNDRMDNREFVGHFTLYR
ncbi:T9SS type B sorting domain-containing protein [Sabulilitoribacter multivorans]|uniref:T9SS type B sorting domain-containing protein n=1 Tax=Flaviramulus multivorans TaxID=1304750 RepID=A0ABS9IH00_9FLAO|nr:T9SS type B sorting domain-containing protein [Flaviramulus multivorans]MCF7560009.1 T9SS type B sorting domain-containing protein [Flaviramulus multivorans]